MAPFTVPGMVNGHSHAFQRDMRGLGERFGGKDVDDFWGWREAMYAVSDRLDPEGMQEVAERCYREMRAAGYTAVGEFHYVHHQRDGTPYDDPNAMALACVDAADRAGLHLTLIPAAYHRAGWDQHDLPPTSGQIRYCDGEIDQFLARVDDLRSRLHGRSGVSVAIAVHSVRAVPAAWIREVARYSDTHGLVRHAHACELRAEVEQVRAEHGASPVEVLHEHGFLGPLSSIVHGTHCTSRDIALLAANDTSVVVCPTTEGNLGDGYPPAMEFQEAGVRIAIGTDSQVRLDPFEEVRELETGARRARQRRAALLAATNGELWTTTAENGARSLGVPGDLPDRIAIDTDHSDLRGIAPEDLHTALVTCGSASVVTETVAAEASRR